LTVPIFLGSTKYAARPVEDNEQMPTDIPIVGFVEWPDDASAVFELQAFTLEVWVRPDSLQEPLVMLAGNLQSFGLDNSGWALLLLNQKFGNHGMEIMQLKIVFVVSDGYDGLQVNGERGMLFTDYIEHHPWGVLEPNVWSHVAGVYDPSLGAQLFLNATLAASRPSYGAPVSFPLFFHLWPFQQIPL
jgi:hypothetical protein